METVHCLKGEKLDMNNSTQSRLRFTRSEFWAEYNNFVLEVILYFKKFTTDIRVIISSSCRMSAATMIACASDKIVMGKQSSLGDIDPHGDVLIIQTKFGIHKMIACTRYRCR